jgi:hypothetical protein
MAQLSAWGPTVRLKNERYTWCVIWSAEDPAHATLLIDDAQTNVRGAAVAGWQAIHFTTPGALREALRDLGVSGMGI